MKEAFKFLVKSVISPHPIAFICALIALDAILSAVIIKKIPCKCLPAVVLVIAGYYTLTAHFIASMHCLDTEIDWIAYMQVWLACLLAS